MGSSRNPANFCKADEELLDRQLLPGQLLTTLESQVLELLFRQLTNKQIAVDLRISERTAKFHVCSVLNKLGVNLVVLKSLTSDHDKQLINSIAPMQPDLEAQK